MPEMTDSMRTSFAELLRDGFGGVLLVAQQDRRQGPTRRSGARQTGRRLSDRPATASTSEAVAARLLRYQARRAIPSA